MFQSAKCFPPSPLKTSIHVQAHTYTRTSVKGGVFSRVKNILLLINLQKPNVIWKESNFLQFE